MRTLTIVAVAAVVLLPQLHGSPPQDTIDPELSRAQRSVWEAWYNGDTARVRALTPGLVAISSHAEGFGDQDGIVQASARFHANGGRLIDLGFTDLHVRHYGDVAVIYSHYHLAIVNGRDTVRDSGRATEIFVRDHGHWLNPGWHLDSSH